MGQSYTLKYQLGRSYKMSNTGNFIIDKNWQVVRTQDYKKKDGMQGQRVFFVNQTTEQTLEREQQYRRNN